MAPKVGEHSLWGSLWGPPQSRGGWEKAPGLGQLQPSHGLPGYANWSWRMEGGLFLSLGLSFPMCALEEEQAKHTLRAF